MNLNYVAVHIASLHNKSIGTDGTWYRNKAYAINCRWASNVNTVQAVNLTAMQIRGAIQVEKVSEPRRLVPRVFLVGNVYGRFHLKILNCLDKFETLITYFKLTQT